MKNEQLIKNFKIKGNKKLPLQHVNWLLVVYYDHDYDDNDTEINKN